MKVFHSAADMHSWLTDQPSTHTIGFVPTMGALHAGHISLVQRAKLENTITVCSIFINPTQFNDPTDFQAYPKTIEADKQLLQANGCDALFLPTEVEIYNNPALRQRSYNLSPLDERWEGANRPGHFQGVCMVVHRLLEIIPTHRLYLGQKDFQQYLILKHLVNHILQWPITVLACPIIREPDGLAMSSRNIRLTPQERQDSLVLSAALQQLKETLPYQPLATCLEEARAILTKATTLQEIDYLAVVDPINLSPITDFEQAENLLAIVAAHFPHARLIDNQVVKGQLL